MTDRKKVNETKMDIHTTIDDIEKVELSCPSLLIAIRHSTTYAAGEPIA